jgi:hypothetical protein
MWDREIRCLHSSGIRLLVAISTPPSWKKAVKRLLKILLAARSGNWNSSRNKIGDFSIMSFANQIRECSDSPSEISGSERDCLSCSSLESVSSMKVLKCHLRFLRFGRLSARRSTSIDFPVPTSPWSSKPLGESSVIAASWLVSTFVKARVSRPSFFEKRWENNGFRRSGCPGAATCVPSSTFGGRSTARPIALRRAAYSFWGE